MRIFGIKIGAALLLLTVWFALSAGVLAEEAAPAADAVAPEAQSQKENAEEKPATQPAEAETEAQPKEQSAAEVPAGALGNAEGFELRGEEISAQMEYLSALKESLQHYQNNEEKEFNLAQAEFILEKLLNLSARTGENRDLLTAITQMRAGAGTLPHTLLARLDWAEVKLNLRLGDAAKARAAADRLQFIRDWRAHPLGTPAATGRVLHCTTPDGLIALDSFFSELELRDFSVSVEIESAQLQEAALRLGAGAAVTGYLNGQKIFVSDETRQPGFDVRAYGLRLNAGRNTLELRLRKATEHPAAFYARLTRPDGASLTELKFSAAPPVAPTAPVAASAAVPEAKASEPNAVVPVAPLVDEGATRILAARLREAPQDHRAGYYLGCLLAARQTFGAAAPAAQQLLLQTVRQAPRSGVYLLAAAAASTDSSRLKPDRDENLRRMLLTKALELDAKNVAALTQLADYYLASMESPDQAEGFIKRALACNPHSPEANLLLCRLYRLRNWQLRAVQVAEELVRRNPGMPAVRLMAAELYMNERSAPDALKEARIALSADQTLAQAYDKQVLILKKLGRPDELETLLLARLTLYPYDNDAWKELVHVRLAAGKAAPAAEALQAALTIRPDDGNLIRLQAEAKQAAGDEAGALALFQKALAINPADTRLRGYLEFRGSGGTTPLTAIPDLGEFARQYAAYRAPAGEERVLLLNEQCDELHADGTKRRTVHIVSRILNQQGAEKNRRLPIWYDGDTEEVRVSVARVLHADGSINTAQTVPVPREGDRQVTLIIFPSLADGDVIEAEYSINQLRRDFFGDYFGNIFAFRAFAPVLQSRYILIAPADKKLYFHQTGSAPAPETKTTNGQTTRTWQMRDLSPIRPLPLMPPLRELSPAVQVSTFRDWDELARWYWSLIKNQNLSNDEIREKTAELTKSAKTPQDKLAALYKWVIAEVRNNAWEFGVHGYKPYNAPAIFTRRFGDCKDKATLLNVMAREAGLEAWPLLLRATDPADPDAGRGAEDLTLPILTHFNHCISMVLAGGKRYYLDGTTTFQDVDSLPFTDAGAQAVVVRPEGAERVDLPPHTAQKNTWEEQLDVRLSADNAADLEFAVKTNGQAAVYLRSWFRDAQTWDNVLRAIATQKYGHVSAVVTEDVSRDEGAADTMRFKGRVRISGYVRKNGDKFTVQLPEPLLAGEFGKDGALPKEFSAFARNSARTVDLVLPTLFTVKRHLRVEWPDGLQLTDKLENQTLTAGFGKLAVVYSLVDNLLEIDYAVEFTRTRIKPEEYKEFRRFCLAADQLLKFNFTFSIPVQETGGAAK